MQRPQILGTLAALAIIGTLLVTGCGGGGSSAVSGSGGSTNGGNTGGGTQPASLTSDQQQAASTSVGAINYTSAILSPISALTLSGQSQASVSMVTPHSNTKPVITVSNINAELVVTANYGAGITGPDGNTTSGLVSIAIDKNDHSGEVAFNDFSVNGKTVTGTITLSSVSFSASGFSCAAALNLTISSFGTITGSAAVSDQSQVLTIANGTFTVTPVSGGTYGITLTNVVINPAANGNSLPDAGTMAISYIPSGSADQTTLLITFNSQTPSTRNVQVSVDGGTTFTVTLPGS
jgi:hypothetical protein